MIESAVTADDSMVIGARGGGWRVAGGEGGALFQTSHSCTNKILEDGVWNKACGGGGGGGGGGWVGVCPCKICLRAAHEAAAAAAGVQCLATKTRRLFVGGGCFTLSQSGSCLSRPRSRTRSSVRSEEFFSTCVYFWNRSAYRSGVIFLPLCLYSEQVGFFLFFLCP